MWAVIIQCWGPELDKKQRKEKFTLWFLYAWAKTAIFLAPISPGSQAYRSKLEYVISSLTSWAFWDLNMLLAFLDLRLAYARSRDFLASTIAWSNFLIINILLYIGILLVLYSRQPLYNIHVVLKYCVLISIVWRYFLVFWWFIIYYC